MPKLETTSSTRPPREPAPQSYGCVPNDDPAALANLADASRMCCGVKNTFREHEGSHLSNSDKPSCTLVEIGYGSIEREVIANMKSALVPRQVDVELGAIAMSFLETYDLGSIADAEKHRHLSVANARIVKEEGTGIPRSDADHVWSGARKEDCRFVKGADTFGLGGGRNVTCPRTAASQSASGLKLSCDADSGGGTTPS